MKDLIRAGITFLETAINVIVFGENPDDETKDRS